MLEWFESIAGPAYASALMWTFLALVGLFVVLLAIRFFRRMGSGAFIAGGRNRRSRLEVLDAAAVDAAFTEVEQRLGPVEIVVANAGITKDTLLLRMSEEDWDAVIQADLKSVFNCCKAAVKPTVARPGNSRRLQNENTALTIINAAPCRPEAARTPLHEPGASPISTSDSAATATSTQGLPGQIAALEAEQAELQALLSGSELYTQGAARIAEVTQRVAAIDDELLALLERWDALGG